MSKLLSILLLSFISIFATKDDQVYIKSNLPCRIYPGGTYTVELTIHKKDLNHYASLTQRLPKGFKAVEKQSGAANFHFIDGELKFTWLRLPKTSTISISYDIVADASVKAGKYSCPAEFVYSYKNLRGSVKLSDSEIMVQSKNGEFANRTDIPTSPKTIQVLRFTPQYQPERGGLLVKLMVSKGDITSKSKITETIPLGYKAQAIETKGAYFQVTNNDVEFIWNELPKSNNFIISYLLSPHKAKSPLPNITGIFRFLQNNKLTDVVVKQADYEHKKASTNTEIDRERQEVLEYFR